MRRGLALGAALALLGCDDGVRELPVAVEAPAQTVEATTAAGGLTGTLRLSPSIVAPGDTVQARFVITNPGPQPVRLTLACTGVAQFALGRADVVTPGGITSTGCLTAITTRSVPPGGEAASQWRFAASLPSFPQPARPLVPGRYYVVVTPAVTEVDGRRLELPPLRVEFTVR